MYQPGRGQLKR